MTLRERSQPPLPARGLRRGRLLPGSLVLASLLLALAGCGERTPPPAPVAPPARLAAGQEVWVPYDPPSDTPTLSPHLRPMDAARTLAEGLRAQALAGADVGPLARSHSGAPSSVGDGLVALPVDATRVDVRDRALLDAPVGGVTPLVDWQHGFWFARRIDMERAARLKPALDTALRSEVRGQAIVISHKEAWPWRHDQRTPREQARQRAEALLAQARAGADFEVLAREASDDRDSAARGGWLWAYDRTTGQASSPWVRWGCPDFPVSVVNHLLRGDLGQPVPEVLDTRVGYVIVRPVERRVAAAPAGAAR
ncbi:MAG: peptidylprolyl isomerase [Planctomycetia bacterium]